MPKLTKANILAAKRPNDKAKASPAAKPRAAAFYVYILECADRTLYTGSTNNLEKRLQEHNGLKSGARYTKTRRPVTLRYSESFRTRGKALQREAKIKSWTRKEKLSLINSSNKT